MKIDWRLGCIPILMLFLAAGCGNDQAKAPSSAQAPETRVSIGTGAISGLYYPTGGAIARLVNNRRSIHRVRLAVESTPGSEANINAVVSGDLEFAIVQSDLQYKAAMGQSEWQPAGPQKSLRSCFSLFSEAVTLIAAEDAGILDIADLRGKRVGVGEPGSGAHQNAIDALTAVGLDYTRDIIAERPKITAAPGLLQDGRIDAFFYTVGHPNGIVKEALSGPRRTRFASIRGIKSFLAERPYYTPSRIPIKYYPSVQNTADVETFGVKATIVTAATVPDNVVYAVVESVFEQLETLKTLHPAYADLTREGMLQALTAEFHPGTLKYLREAGLVK